MLIDDGVLLTVNMPNGGLFLERKWYAGRMSYHISRLDTMNTWMHVGIVFARPMLEYSFYVNGTLVRMSSLGDAQYWNKSFVIQKTQFCSTVDASTFGCKSDSPNAAIDDVYFFNRSVNQSEMLTLMNNCTLH